MSNPDNSNEATSTAHEATVHLHAEHRVGAIDERIFGGFLEHMGRAVYGGVYDPGNDRSDTDGFRTDVLDALGQLRMPIIRYPGGNFVSAHNWRHAIGPRDQRPRRPDFAWRSIETNQFGTDEFITWCERLGTEPMMAVNLGTGTPAEAAELLEYCNLPAGTSVADERVANGHPDPYGVKVWCLGNEMDGFWQAGHVPAQTYAERALNASQLMKGLDPSIQTVVCGSSARALPTYLEWDRIVLEHCWSSVDHVSVHRYSRNDNDDTPSFLAEGVAIEQMLGEYRGLLDYLAGRLRGFNRVTLSFDEWNVWYRETGTDGSFEEAPHLLEEQYNIEDALVCAQYLNAFLRHADIVKIASIAQIVNVIAPVLTRPDGILVQSIYWPFKLLRDTVSGDALRVAVDAPTMPTRRRGDVPVIDVAATIDDAAGNATVSLVNRDHTRPVDTVIRVADRTCHIEHVNVLAGEPKLGNTWENPDAVRPVPGTAGVADDGSIRVQLPAASHVVVGLGVPARS